MTDFAFRQSPPPQQADPPVYTPEWLALRVEAIRRLMVQGQSSAAPMSPGGGVPAGMIPTGLPKIAQGIASGSSSLDFTNLTGYRAYLFVLQNLVPGTNAQDFYIRASTDNGATFDATAGRYNYNFVYSQGTGTTIGGIGDGGTATAWTPAISTSSLAGAGISADLLYIPGVSGTDFSRISGRLTNWHSSSALITSNVGGIYGLSTTPNAIRFLFAIGTISTGKIALYGLNN